VIHHIEPSRRDYLRISHKSVRMWVYPQSILLCPPCSCYKKVFRTETLEFACPGVRELELELLRLWPLSFCRVFGSLRILHLAWAAVLVGAVLLADLVERRESKLIQPALALVVEWKCPASHLTDLPAWTVQQALAQGAHTL